MKLLIKKAIGVFCFGVGLLQSATAAQVFRIVPEAYEFKVMLKNEPFASVNKGIIDFQKAIATQSAGSKVMFSADDEPKERIVSYMDTKQCHLYNNGFILRKRFTLKKGLPESLKVTLKFRGSDMNVVGGKVIVAQPSLALTQSKFEADVVRGNTLSEPAYKYSHSTSIKLGKFKKMSDLMALYPVLQALETNGHPKLDKPKEKLKWVNNFTAFESVFEVGSIKIADTSCEASFSFWYVTQEKSEPIASEFSYVCEQETDEVKQLFQTILDLSEWLSSNPEAKTKTQIAYGKFCPSR